MAKWKDVELSRRAFLEKLAAVAGTAGAVGAGLVFCDGEARAQGSGGLKPIGYYLGIPIYLAKLRVARVTQSFPDLSSVPFFRYQAVAPVPSLGETPLIDIPESSILAVEVDNQTSLPIIPSLEGQVIGPMVLPKQKNDLVLLAPRAGTWLLGQAGWQRAAGPAGFGAVLVTRPKSGKKELWAGGPQYDKEFILAYSDCDDRWNRALAAQKMPNLGLYEPNYFTLNGLTWPKTATHASTRVLCRLGDRVLVRFANFGNVRQSIHFHGYHADVAARNNVPEKFLGPKDTVPVPSLQSTDVIFVAKQRGKYPLHPHFVPAVTANGTYPYGQLALIECV